MFLFRMETVKPKPKHTTTADTSHNAPKPNISKIKRVPQAQRYAGNAKPGTPLTDEQIEKVCSAIEKGKIKLPPVKEGETIILMDSGSRPTIADRDKHFPGAELRQSQAQREGRGYSSATGEAFPNEGEFTVRARTQEGHERDIVFQHSSKVAIPILSTGGLTDADNDVTYQKTGGYILHNPTKQLSRFMRLHGVYFIKMMVSLSVLLGNDKNKNPKSDFARPGP